ncbi:unnamed protein product [Rotaria socialis]|uniref:Uncharacterized protein n=1 Tax=Rotaria socialis TaxID=392032 RepID=A0A818JTF1_9BILA|nr:unnamed protein product [Rotaria socialis]CAF3343904.1 unnamed protein product [Rotaria socialis]CAF3544924.1 unnamed protein product [Rotaria socialis]CAF3682444.1 unnamed protein product [Rotaria socialis]CAF3735855.1 unnamed protein product [Rotaria socialis]
MAVEVVHQIYTKIFMIMILIAFTNRVKALIRDIEFSEGHSIKSSATNIPIFTIPSLTKSGTDFGNSIMNVGPTQSREDLIFEQFKIGNIPDFMRNAISITTTAGNDTITYWVLPDVLCVGTNKDYLRTSMSPLTAKKIADLYSCVLPTRKMAFQIWQAATVKLNPSPNGPPYDATMLSTERMVFHNKKIQDALTNQIPGELVSGHKKDVVISAGLLSYPKNVAIVGWWYPSGQMIQPLNYVSHDHHYKDYSHGIRLINRMVTINGQWHDIYDVLRSKTLSILISDEGSFDATQIYV